MILLPNTPLLQPLKRLGVMTMMTPKCKLSVLLSIIYTVECGIAGRL
jgi:hypothetical protein